PSAGVVLKEGVCNRNAAIAADGCAAGCVGRVVTDELATEQRSVSRRAYIETASTVVDKGGISDRPITGRNDRRAFAIVALNRAVSHFHIPRPDCRTAE